MVKSLATGLLILNCLGTKPHAGPTEISRELKYGKSTVIRSLQTMEALGFVKRDGTNGHYEIGTKVLELAHNFLERHEGIVSLADDHIRVLWSKYGETVSLYIREGDARVCIFRLESPSPLRYAVRLGEVRPLYLEAAGKSFLAYMPQDEVEALFVREHVDPERVSRLRVELPEIRQKGVAFSYGERGSGRASVAAPILNRREEPIAVLSISGPLQRLSSTRLHEIAGPLSVAVHGIAHRVLA